MNYAYYCGVLETLMKETHERIERKQRMNPDYSRAFCTELVVDEMKAEAASKARQYMEKAVS